MILTSTIEILKSCILLMSSQTHTTKNSNYLSYWYCKATVNLFFFEFKRHWKLCVHVTYYFRWNIIFFFDKNISLISTLVKVSILTISWVGGGYTHSLWFFALYSKNLQEPHTWKFCLFSTFCCWCPYEKKHKILVLLLSELFWDTQYGVLVINIG